MKIHDSFGQLDPKKDGKRKQPRKTRNIATSIISIETNRASSYKNWIFVKVLFCFYIVMLVSSFVHSFNLLNTTTFCVLFWYEGRKWCYKVEVGKRRTLPIEEFESRKHQKQNIFS